MGYRDILKHYSGVSIRTVGSGTSSGGGLFGWLRRLLGHVKNQKELRKILLK